jgi:hypothetical protein
MKTKEGSVKNVLLLGRTGIVLDDVEEQLEVSDLELFAGTSLSDVREVFKANQIDTVIMGAGLDLALRLEIIEEIFDASQTTTVHMKDFASGPGGMLPFVNGVLKGLP